MSPKQISEVLFQIFSDEGFAVNGIKVKSESPLVASINSEGGRTTISFENNLPRAEITRLITLYAYIEELVFGEAGGTIKLRNFPDISFGYDKSLLREFLENLNFAYQGEMHNYIDEEYSDTKKRKIATDCLQYANEWATIVSQSGGFCGISSSDKAALKKQCYDFVVENVRKNARERKYGFGIGMYILIFILIPTICKFIVYKLLEKYFD